MKNLRLFTAICLMIFMISCDEQSVVPGSGITEEFSDLGAKKGASITPRKITGFVEVEWKGADKGGDMGNKPEDLRTFMDLTAIEAYGNKGPRGELVFTVLEPDLTPHREILAEVMDVQIGYESGKLKGWVVAVVRSDTKGCSGNGGSGHDDSCGGSGEDPSSHDGGCSHDETDEGGCSHDTGDEGGCSHDTTDEGGCSHDDTGEGGCSGSGGSPDMHGGSPGGSDQGNPTSGKNCRVGQILALKTHDGGTPGINNDGITWKWFSPDGAFVPAIDNISLWPHLCKKVILEGNIVIHLY